MIEDTPVSSGAQAHVLGASERRERLRAVFLEARACTRCAQLAGARTQVVFGGGNADAELMLIGEAPGAREDEQGVPFVGAAGKLLDELLASVGLARGDVFITNALKCRPPGNRDPAPTEIERCRPYLEEQIALVQPRVIVTLGNFATRLLRGSGDGITELHGKPEVIAIAGRAAHLLPLFHPAAALYTRSLLDTLREDAARIPELLALPDLPQPEPVESAPAQTGLDVTEPKPEVADEAALDERAPASAGPPTDAAPKPPAGSDPGEEPPQLGLF